MPDADPLRQVTTTAAAKKRIAERNRKYQADFRERQRALRRAHGHVEVRVTIHPDYRPDLLGVVETMQAPKPSDEAA